MHYAKLMRAFSHLNGVIDVESDIEIIDYGCGQAIGSMTFIEYCLQNDIGISRIKQVTLIEPSMTTLKRGAMHIRKFVPDVEIVTVNKSLNDLAQDDIKTLVFDLVRSRRSVRFLQRFLEEKIYVPKIWTKNILMVGLVNYNFFIINIIHRRVEISFLNC